MLVFLAAILLVVMVLPSAFAAEDKETPAPVVTGDSSDSGKDPSASPSGDSESKDSNNAVGGSNTGNSTENKGAMATTSTMLEMAAGKSSKDATKGVSITNEDARMLGVFMSNFYTPFSTEVGKNNDEAVKKQMDQVLTKSLSFSETMSKQIQDYIRSQTQNQSKDLHWAYSDKENAEGKDLWVPEKKDNAASYMNLHLYMSGHFRDHIKADAKWGEDPETESDTFNKIMKENRKWAYLYYDGKDGPTTVFQLDLENNKETPSTLAMRKVLDGIDPSNGWGSSVFDIKKGDNGLNSPEDISKDKDPFKGKSGNEQLNSTSLGAPLKVSPFGDIWMDSTNHKTFVMPGAINPYVWEGKGAKRGETFNMINVISMAQSTAGKLNDGTEDIKDRPKGVKKVTYKHDTTNERLDTFNRHLKDRPKFMNTSDYKNAYYGWPWMKGDSESDKFTQNDRQSWLKSLLTKEYYGKWEDNFGPMYYMNGGWVKGSSDEFNNSGERAKAKGDKGNEPDAGKKVGLPQGGPDQGFDHWWWPYIWDKTHEPTSQVNTMTNMMVMDNLGVFKWGSKEGDLDYNALKTVSYLDGEGKGLDAVSGTMNKKENGTEVDYANMGSGDKMRVASDFSDNYKQSVVSIYSTYAYAFYGSGEDLDKLGMSGKAADKLPDLSAGTMEMSAEEKEKATSDAIRDWMYYALHPDIGRFYVGRLINKYVNSFAWKAHSEMVGTEGVGALPGSTKYISFSGYVTTPELSDVPLTDRLLVLYKQNFIFIMLAVVVALVIAAIAGTVTFGGAVLSVALIALLAVTAPSVINSGISASNSITDKWYGKKFMYWALISNQIYSQEIDKAAEGSDYDNYLQTVYKQNNNALVNNNQGTSNVVVRWQAPKKMASLLSSTKTNKKDDDSDRENKLNAMLNGVGEDAIDGQDYLLKNNATYMFRSYVDLGNFSRYIYRGVKENQKVASEVPEDTINKWPDKGLQNNYRNYVEDKDNAVFEGYDAPNVSGSSDARNYLSVRAPLSSNITADAFKQTDKIAEGLNQSDFMGVPEGAFKFGIPMFAQKGDLVKGVKDVSSKDGMAYDAAEKGYKAEDLSGLASYALMSESPYYSFSWNLYDRGMDPSNGASENFKNMMLSNGGMFSNKTKGGNGDTRDYMGMRDLFTYTIPYMKQGNDVVNAYDEKYGLKYHKGLPTTPGHENDEGIKGDPVKLQQYWSNVNVAQLYGIYAPWVDLMYDTPYAKSERVSFQGKKVVIDDPLNPASYPKDRPMVFSESEMKDYGLGMDDLTQVESKIIEVEKNTQERWYSLMNYYSFEDSVLNSAASMEATFEFNRVFSSPSITGARTDVKMYPQNFELKNFTYDAYLRLMLAESISGQGSPNGEDPTAALLQSGAGTVKDIGEGKDFYMTLQDQTGMPFSILLVINDFVAIYVFPIVKYIFLIMIVLVFFMMIFAQIRNLFGEDTFFEKVKTVWKTALKPYVMFLLILTGMGFVVSLFMSNGSTAVTGYDGPTISLGDPTLTLAALLLVNVLAGIGMIKVNIDLVKGGHQLASMIYQDGANQVAGAANKAGGFMKGAVLGAAGGALGAIGLKGMKDRMKSAGKGAKGTGGDGGNGGNGGASGGNGGGNGGPNPAPHGGNGGGEPSKDDVPTEVPGMRDQTSRKARAAAAAGAGAAAAATLFKGKKGDDPEGDTPADPKNPRGPRGPRDGGGQNSPEGTSAGRSRGRGRGADDMADPSAHSHTTDGGRHASRGVADGRPTDGPTGASGAPGASGASGARGGASAASAAGGAASAFGASQINQAARNMNRGSRRAANQFSNAAGRSESAAGDIKSAASTLRSNSQSPNASPGGNTSEGAPKDSKGSGRRSAGSGNTRGAAPSRGQGTSKSSSDTPNQDDLFGRDRRGRRG